LNPAKKQVVMEVLKTDIPGVLILEPKVFHDPRGYFLESFSQREFDAKIVPEVLYASADGGVSPQYKYMGEERIVFVQDNESRSRYGVIRGLHFQRPPYAQSKLVRVAIGAVLDVAVDIRKGSPTYGRHVSVELSADNHRILFLPRGIAHGFSVLSDDVIFQYKCDSFYSLQSEGAIAWNDPDLAIDWRIPEKDALLSQKDLNHPLFRDFDSPFKY
jgi:dTDP-4-dehydrorhamnose 3,5-epimerase